MTDSQQCQLHYSQL